MISRYTRKLRGCLLLVLSIAITACSSQNPEESPEAVTKRFYDLITASKVEGGTSPASEAYKLINSEASNLNVNQFLEIIKNYPPNFKVEIGKAEVKGNQALVAISYKLPSSFGGEYTVNQIVPLNIDPATRTWKIDFTGDTYGMQKDEAIAAHKTEAAPQQDIKR
ncbi:MAG: hypothetical protein OEV35_04130 [Gallionellaceae bacterium]|nr:hypothetical protein [Gallionellaceae bacterium]